MLRLWFFTPVKKKYWFFKKKNSRKKHVFLNIIYLRLSSDAYHWDQLQGDFDERTTDDLDVDTGVYYGYGAWKWMRVVNMCE